MSNSQSILQNTEVGSIPSHWDVVPFREVCTESAFGPRFSGNLYSPDGNVATLRTTDLDDWGRISYSTMPLAKLDTEKFQKHFLKPGDLVITRSGTCGRTAIFENFHVPVVPGAFSIRFRLSSQADNRFFRYYFNSNIGRQRVIALTTGTVQPNLTSTALLNLKVPLPPLPEQKAIAHILGTLDDKIELNQQMNGTLEAIARTIFKSWFVDFNPVRAKMDGKQPVGMDAATADLFPDEFEDSALGKIPKGWLYKSAQTISNVGIGKTPPRKEPEWFSKSCHDVRWVSIRDMGESGTFISNTKEYLVPEAITRFNVRIVPDYTVILSFKLTIGRVALTDGEMTTNEAIAHFKLSSKSQLSSEYLYLYLKTFDYRGLGNTSSIAEAVNSKIIKAMPILIPNGDLMEQFTNQVADIFARIKGNQRESCTLATIRYTLLPKLLSGEIRIKEAEKIVEEVA
ncbi:MAG: restriction endonuclease subunit S [Coleofasciculaceae cyanobacterium]